MGRIINNVGNDIADQFVNSPTSNAPLYFFIGQVREWQGRHGILGVTQTNPITITITPGHDVASGQTVLLSDISGMVEANDVSGVVTDVTGDVVTIGSVDATTFSSYTSNGVLAIQKTALANDEYDLEDVRHSIIGMKRVTGDMMSHAIAMKEWFPQQIYKYYDPQINNEGHEYYTVTDNRVYMCLDNAKSTYTTYQPVHTSATPKKYPDGYTWKYMYTVSDSDAAKFMSDDWVPVRPLSQNQSNGGGIESIITVTKGQDYLHGDSVVIIGDGEGATAYIGQFEGSGLVHHITVDNPGQNYTWAKAYIVPSALSSGTGAMVQPIITPEGGYGNFPTRDLLADNVTFVVDLDGNEDGELFTGDIRSRGIIRSPLDSSNNPIFTTDIVDFRSKITVSGSGQKFTTGQIVTGNVSGATAICAGSSEDVIYTVEETGAFEVGETITSLTGATTIEAFASGNIEQLNLANFIYVDSTSGPHTRNDNQVDTFTVTLSF